MLKSKQRIRRPRSSLAFWSRASVLHTLARLARAASLRSLGAFCGAIDYVTHAGSRLVSLSAPGSHPLRIRTGLSSKHSLTLAPHTAADAVDAT